MGNLTVVKLIIGFRWIEEERMTLKIYGPPARIVIEAKSTPQKRNIWAAKAMIFWKTFDQQ
jgi:hypothetical protein